MTSRFPRLLMPIARTFGAAAFCALATVRAAFGQDDAMDRIDDQLTFSGWNDSVRARVSGTLDLEGYAVSQPAPGLLYAEGNEFFIPRLSLYLDSQLGPQIYVFAQARADSGFDPGEGGPVVRMDEYAIRYTPWSDGRFNLQVGKFETVVGNWAPRHGSWDNPFITAPLPYENVTGIWDTTAARFSEELQAWSGILPKPTVGGALLDHYRNVPIIWGPSYAAGASIFGDIGKFDYAFEVKNTSLSGRPETWSPIETQWREPTFSGRLGYLPNEMWNLGFSASVGPYLQSGAESTIPPGRNIDQYLEMVLGQDIAFAWHHVQLWAEFYEARFTIPGVGNADTQAYYVEAKYKFTPQFFAALRWNQQLFSSLPDPMGPSEGWSRNVWRVDLGPGYRFSAHTQLKLQYSVEYQQADMRNWEALLAVQFTTRF